MPWFLKQLKKKVVKIGLILFCAGAFFGIVRLYMLAILCCLLLIGHFALFLLNIIAKDKLNSIAQVFMPNGKVRNADYLIIGDMYKHLDNGLSVQILAPGRGINSCYEILRHTHSILKENGTVIIAVKKGCVNNGFTAFDTPYFHHISINRLNLEKIKAKERLIAYCYPLIALRYVLDIKNANFKSDNNFITQIDKFCEERGYNLQYKIK